MTSYKKNNVSNHSKCVIIITVYLTLRNATSSFHCEYMQCHTLSPMLYITQYSSPTPFSMLSTVIFYLTWIRTCYLPFQNAHILIVLKIMFKSFKVNYKSEYIQNLEYALLNSYCNSFLYSPRFSLQHSSFYKWASLPFISRSWDIEFLALVQLFPSLISLL
jgi:hypothetical protein